MTTTRYCLITVFFSLWLGGCGPGQPADSAASQAAGNAADGNIDKDEVENFSLFEKLLR